VEGLTQFLREQSPGGLLPWASQAAAAKRFGFSYAQVEETALRLGLLPSRYQRNRQTLSVDNQLKLFRSRVAVVGCGGIGGYVIEELARLGVGTLAAIDPDVFEEHNLNRQILATMGALGRAKVQVAAARVTEINPAVTLIPVQTAWLPENGKELLAAAEVVVDALDSITTRLALAATCAEVGIPFVHGAIAGWYGQVTTQFPGDNSVQRLYGDGRSRGIEQQLGNPAFTPPLVASLQTSEVCKIVLGVGNTLRNRIVFVDLRDMTFSEMTLASQTGTQAAQRAMPT
jgi:molybdopterin/thiamine biosynthesis adenylyltransferase